MEQPKKNHPDWLDNALLEKALRSYKNDDTIKVSSFNVKNSGGEHFGSSMLHAKVEYLSTKLSKSKPEVLEVVIKAKSVDNGALPLDDVFEVETKMYKEALPAIKQLFERSGLKYDIAPELIYAAREPFYIIILKDLSSKGFKALRDSPDELNENSKLIISKLAKFHAASYYLVENNEFDFSSFDYSLFKNEVLVKNFYEDTLKTFKEVLKTWDGFEEFIPNVENLMKNVQKIGKLINTPNKPGHGYNVLNHGDFHVRNLLGKMNEDQIMDEFYFVDFQLSNYCSPVIDLNYVFGLIVRDTKGDRPTEEIVLFYYEEFVKALKVFGFLKAPPTLLDLNVELMKHGKLSVLHSICFTPFSFADWGTMKVDDFMEGGEDKDFKKKMFEHPVCKQMIQRQMKSWVYKGWF